MEGQIGLHDTVPSQMHEDTFTVSTVASCTVPFLHIKSSLLEEDDPAWLLHEEPTGLVSLEIKVASWLTSPYLQLNLGELIEDAASLREGFWFLHQQ